MEPKQLRTLGAIVLFLAFAACLPLVFSDADKSVLDQWRAMSDAEQIEFLAAGIPDYLPEYTHSDIVLDGMMNMEYVIQNHGNEIYDTKSDSLEEARELALAFSIGFIRTELKKSEELNFWDR